MEQSQEDPAALRQKYGERRLALLEKLNRADVEHLARLKAYIVPSVWDADELSYSPLPIEYERAREKKKAIVVHLPQQVFGGYEQGRLVRWGPVSSGSAKSPTPQGQYHLNWRSRGHQSTVDERWFLPWYFNFINKRGISFHEFALPGYPASHSCLRLLKRDAMWLFSWGEEWKLDSKGWKISEQGTPVLILGQYRFDQPPPWLSPGAWAEKIVLPAGPGW
jgi:hypothetical protein